jgi:predicted ATPase
MRHILQAVSSPSEAKQPHFLLLTGEAGIGKTRLVEELSIEAYTQGWLVAWNQGNEQERLLPYRPWETLLHALPLPSRLAQPYVHQQERVQLWDEVLKLLNTGSQIYPLLFILDDLQWVDEESIDLLGYLIHHLQEQRILLIATCRDEELAQAQKLHMLITDMQRKQELVTLPVQPLTSMEIGTLLAHLPPQIAQSAQVQAAGNPFFAQELARLARQNQSQVVLPETITALFERRLSKLSQGCQACLEKAALLGATFDLDQLLSLMHTRTEEDIFDLLEEALHTKLLREEAAHPVHIMYHFCHPLLARFLRERHSVSPHV